MHCLFATMVVALAATLSAQGCAAGGTRVSRVASDKPTDLSGRWNDADARETAQVLAQQCFAAPWLGQFRDAHGRVPAVRLRAVINKTDEHIDQQIFIKDIERALLLSGQVRVLAQAGQELRVTGDEQRLGASGAVDEETAASMGNMTGADFVATVRLASSVDQSQGSSARFYQINLELIDASTGEKACIAEHEIKKIVERARVAW